MVKTLAPADQTSIAAGKSKGPEVGRAKDLTHPVVDQS